MIFTLQQLEPFKSNPAIVWIEQKANPLVFNYDQVLDAANKIAKVLRKDVFTVDQISGREYIGVMIADSPLIVPSILGILESDHPFYCVEKLIKHIDKCLDNFQVNLIISEEDHIDDDRFKCIHKLFIWERHLFFYRRICWVNRSHGSSADGNPKQIMFGVCTSGSTGTPKSLCVPFDCLLLNVRDLIDYYQLSSKDVVFVSAPPTFDPFVLDMFLALTVGASIVLVSALLRVPSPELASLLFHNNRNDCSSVTIMQITPSLFKLFTVDTIRQVILAPRKTTLRLLIFGGEPFPSRADLIEWSIVSDNNKLTTKLVNIYGCTEMSCWSTVHELRLDELIKVGKTSLGQPIGGTCELLLIDPETRQAVPGNGTGELYLTSKTRYTYMYGSNEMMTKVKTGDLVERKDGEFYYISRCSEVIKRYGTRVDLKRINEVANKYELMKEACCVFDTASNTLGLFVQLSQTSVKDIPNMWTLLRKELQPKELPDAIRIVENFPLSNHGKISNRKLIQMLMTKKPPPSIPADVYFLRKLEEIFGNDIKEIKHRSFMDLGGTSFLALSITSDLERVYKCLLTRLMVMMLDPTTLITCILKYIETTAISYYSNNEQLNEIFVGQPQIYWKYDLGKCVDATPTLLQCDGEELVSIGSHSHRLVTIRTDSGKLVSELVLPDRIEGQVRQIGRSSMCVVGCYDGHLYCFDAIRGTLEWKFQSGGMIKCQPVCVGNDGIVFGNYSKDHNLYCVDAKTGNLVWSTKVGTKSIYANPLVFATDIVVCTLDGTYARFNSQTGDSIWTKSLSSPIFSSPKQINDPTCCMMVITEVLGIVHCIDLNGNEIWNFRADGNIYSSLTQLDHTILFGCHDHFVYCLQCNDGSLNWRARLSGPVFAKPLPFDNHRTVVACSTNGEIAAIDSLSGKLMRRICVEGELFSSPVESVIHPGKIVIGCRNNNVYSLQV